MKGIKTHYMVLCIRKDSLLQLGALKAAATNSRVLLRPDNLDRECLKRVAAQCAAVCGVYGDYQKKGMDAKTALVDVESRMELYPHHGMQIFDFSTRARVMESVKLLHAGGRVVEEWDGEDGEFHFSVLG